MNIALTLWGERISPVFDAAEFLLIAQTDRRRVITHRTHRFDLADTCGLVGFFRQQRVAVLICGAISEKPARIIETAGITVIPFMTGNARQVLTAYLEEKPLVDFLMPGCFASWEIAGRRQRHASDPPLADDTARP